jgi:hypothetical protein
MQFTGFRLILLLFFILHFIPSRANFKSDSTKLSSTDSTRIFYFQSSFDSLFLGAIHAVDTSSFNVTDFDALEKTNGNFATLSNIGSPHKNLVLENSFYNGYQTENQVFSQILPGFEDIRYVMPLLPFSELYYTMGAKKEQQFDVSFARQLFPRFTIGMEFALNNSPGIYKNSKSENTRVYFTGRYHTKNERYALTGNYVHNKIKFQENGGIQNDSIFEYNIESDRRLIPINLTDAENLVKESGFGFEQYFNFVKPNPIKVNDSTFQPRRFQFGRLTHRFSYQRNQMVYSEETPLAAFYASFDPVIDSNNSYDSVYQMIVKNQLYLSTLGYKKYNGGVPFYFYAGAEHVYIVQSDSLKKSIYNQINPFGGIRISLFKSSYLDGKAKLISGGYGAGDLQIDAGIKQFLGTSDRNLGNLFFRVNIINQSPSWMFERYQSNHFRWKNTFSKSKYITFNGGYSFKGITVGGRIHIMDKYIYYNKFARPQQSTGTSNLRHLYTNFHVYPGKFEISGSFDFQNVNNDSVIHLPKYSGKLKFSIAQDLFAKAATIKPGFTIHWFSEYYADAYMPALRAFYLQDEKKIGNYPFVDVFVTLKVKRANLFLEYANVFGLFGDYNYYTTVHYPMRDPRLYFGIKWRFFK